MKILHTSDWHLGKRLDDVSRLEEQRAVLTEIADIARQEQVDAVMVAGDLFDTFNPPTEAVELLYSTLKRLTNNGKRLVIAIAGNHDSPDRIEAPDPLARECGIIFAGYPDSQIPTFTLESGLTVSHSEPGFLEVLLPNNPVALRILLTPYANEFRLKTCLENTGSELSEEPASANEENRESNLRELLQQKWQQLADRYCDDQGVNVLLSHLFINRKGNDLPEEPEEEKPILHVGGASVVYSENIPKSMQYVALGHLHRMQSVDSQPCPIYYSGSPLSYSFAEANQQKQVLLVDIEPGKAAAVRAIPLTQGKPLLRKRAESMEEALQWLTAHPDAWVELTLVTDTYLTAADRRTLNAVHAGIVTLIPEITGLSGQIHGQSNTIDLSRNMEELFKDYFRHEKGQEPNEEIMQLFTEMLGEEDEQ